MAGKHCDTAGLHDPYGTSANAGSHDNAGTAPETTTDNASTHAAHGATAATTAMDVECQWQ